MLYEIILSEKCTRQCAFCTLKQTDYIESIDNINKYYKHIINYQSLHGNQYFFISLFGGEPLLNISGVKHCVQLFRNKNCDINLYTNADLIELLYDKDFTQHLTVQISAYEIFSNVTKYKDILKKLKCKRIQFAYTFSEIDINKINEFILICKSLNVDYKFSFSHTASSWNNMSINQIYQYIFDYYVNAMNSFYENSQSLIIPKTLNREFTLATDLLFNYKSYIKTCISQSKQVFNRGLMIGPCIKLFYKTVRNNIPYNCLLCQYKNVCSKSCIDEHINGNVPEKLCIIEKAKIESMLYIINQHATEYKMKKIVQYNIDKMNGVYKYGNH